MSKNIKYISQQIIIKMPNPHHQINKNEIHIFNKFVRKFHAAIERFGRCQIISIQKLINILHYLGYVDQYINQQTKQLAHTISYMLSKQKDCLITEQSLFNFLRIITNAPKFQCDLFKKNVKELDSEENNVSINVNEQPLIALRIGRFDKNQDWTCTLQEEIQVKEIFGNMNIKRLSRQKIEAEIKQNNFLEEETFHPQILDKSKNMAEKKYRKLSLSQKSQKVEDRLLHNLSVQKSNLQNEMNKSRQKQMKECYFKPKINTPKRKMLSICKYVDSMNSSFQNKQNNQSISNISSMNIDSSQSKTKCLKNKINLIGDKLLMKGKQYEKNKQNLKKEYQQVQEYFQMKQCSFQPKIYQKAYPIKNTKYVRNAEKSIQRVKQARKKRQFENNVKQRGYPSNLDWTKFINSYKNNQIQNKNPILCIDLKLFDETKNIKVYEGSSIEDISKKICLQNSIAQEFWKKVEVLLRNSLQQCNQIKFFQDRIYVRQ